MGPFWHTRNNEKSSCAERTLLPMTVSQSCSTVHFEALDESIREMLGEVANDLARETKFVQRSSEMTGAHFAQALIFGWLANPDASYTFLQQMLAIAGCQVSAQALEKRMTPRAADYLLSLLHALVSCCVTGDPVMTEVINRFEGGIFLQDGSVISLPSQMEGIYRGHGGNTAQSGRSALRVQVRLNLSTGAMQGPWLTDAVHGERKGASSLHAEPLPKGALYLTDSGYVTLAEIAQHEQEERWWMSHARSDWRITDTHGLERSLPEFLRSRGTCHLIDEWVMIGSVKRKQQRVRLMAFRVSKETENRRKAKAQKHSKTRAKGSRGDVLVGKKHRRAKAGRHRHRPSQKRLALCDWTILLSNVPQEKLSASEARILMRSRWQIELLWRLWKERGQVDIWRSEKPMRILCEVYAKLMGCLIQHWVIIQGCWRHPHRSMVKASQAVRGLAVAYLLSCTVTALTSVHVLQAMQRAMQRSRLNHRPRRLSTAQLLELPDRTLPPFG